MLNKHACIPVKKKDLFKAGYIYSPNIPLRTTPSLLSPWIKKKSELKSRIDKDDNLESWSLDDLEALEKFIAEECGEDISEWVESYNGKSRETFRNFSVGQEKFPESYLK